MKVPIKKSPQLKQFRMIAVSIVALVLVLFTSQILRFIGGLAAVEMPALGLLIRLLVIMIGVLAVLVTWLQDRSTAYELDDNKLIITKGILSGRQQIISLNPETVLNIELHQSLLGSKLDYGVITIEMAHSGGTAVYELRNIAAPHSIFAQLDAYVHGPRD